MKLLTIILGVIFVLGLCAYFVLEPAENKTENVDLPKTGANFVSYTFFCPDSTSFEVTYDTLAEHATLVLEGDMVLLLNRATSASGARYVSEDASVEFWEHGGEATVATPSKKYEGCIVPELQTDSSVPEDVLHHITEKSDLIKLTSPLPLEEVSSPVRISGEARGYWYFEASFPIVVTDWGGKIIGEGYATSTGDWMTEDFVPFTAVVEYTQTENSYSNRGLLILRKSNPSDLPENDDALEVPIVLQ